jgi:hypothetical protein
MAQYVHFGIFLITVPNLIVIVLMLLVFALGAVAVVAFFVAQSLN